MRAKNDDEIYDVDGTYLGPPGRYIARMKYKTVLIYLATALPAFILLRQLHLMPYSVMSVGLFILVSVRIAQIMSKKLTRERPFTAVSSALVHDVHAPKYPERYASRPFSPRVAKRITAGINAAQLQNSIPRTNRRLRARDWERKNA